MSLAAIVLAAGSARRFGSDKLSAQFKDEPLIAHAIRAARAAPVARVIVAARPGLDIGQWQSAPPVEAVILASAALSDSLKAGIAAAAGAEGAFVFLGDMPLVPHGIAARLADAIGDCFAAVPVHRGQPGHPVLLSARAMAAASELEGDRGLGALLRTRDDVIRLDCDDPQILLDIDRPDDLARIAEGGNGGDTGQ